MKEIDLCSLCGMCKTNCPVLISGQERDSPRTKALLAKKGLNSNIFHKCTLCNSCRLECPAGIDLDKIIIQKRAHLVNKNQETLPNKKMIDNLKKTNNPFGYLKEKPLNDYIDS